MRDSLQFLAEQYSAFTDVFGALRLTKSQLLLLSLRKLCHDISFQWSDAKEIWQCSNPRIVYTIAALALLLTVYLFDWAFLSYTSLTRQGVPRLRRLKGIHRWDYEAILQQGAREYPDSPYTISYSGYEYAVYPSKCFNEVQRLPESTASGVEWFTHVITQGWRLLGTHSGVQHKTFAIDLARAVPVQVHQRQKQSRSAFDAVFGPCTEWTSIRLFWNIQKIVAVTNATSLTGADLGTNPRWLTAVQFFPVSIMLGVYGSHTVPRIIRPLVSPVALLPARMFAKYMEVLLRPMARHDLEEYENASRTGEKEKLVSATSNKKFPIVAWLLSRMRPEQRTLDRIIHYLIVVAFMSTGTSAGALYYTMGELASRPELVSELREEIASFMVDGNLPLSHLDELKKLDSVMCESARLYPISHLVLNRRLRKPVKLTVGPEMPAGSLICVDAFHLTQSEDMWDNPTVFEPMRFLKLREQPGNQGRYLFTSTGPEFPSWGDGPQACPGRVFAANTLKIILAELIMRYDLRLGTGGAMPKRSSMPNGSFAPDLRFEVMVKRRENA